MKLNNLPKDLIVELVSELQNRKEKEYSEYIVIWGGSEDPVIWYFNNENELKGWILFDLFKSPSISYTDNENVYLFLEDLSKFPKYQYDLHIEYCKNKSSGFQLDELLNMFNKNSKDLVIIKGKCVSGNTKRLLGF